MATLLPNVRLQFLDGNGAPLVGGKLYSYAAGTTTPLATYTDQSEGTPNSNPVILDANGMATVWISAASYKLQLQDSVGTVLWTVDNVASIFDGSVSTTKLADGAVTTVKLAVGVLSADSAGRAKMAAQFIQTTHIGDQQVTAGKVANNGLGLAQMASGIGFVPTGGCIPFFGTTLPAGFLWCDGSSYLRATYASLYAAIGNACGTADGTHFNVPDMRGRFMRGSDEIPGGSPAGNDPDASSRIAMNTGGNTGINVGSIQTDQVIAHAHTISLGTAGSNGNRVLGTDQGQAATTNTLSVGTSTETRPRNSSCHWIIKN